MMNDDEHGPIQRPLYWAVFDHLAHKGTMSVGERLDEFAREAALADRLGLDYYFTTEHHFSKDFSLSPSQSISLTVIARETSRIRFGPLVVILPVSQPLRVAEELTLLDHLSNGRLEVGLGRGIREHELLTYGVDPDTAVQRVEEGLDVIRQAWSTEGRFSFSGEHYQYAEVEMPWRPVQKPHPPIWMPSNTPANAEEHGRNGFGGGGFSFLTASFYAPVAAAYERGYQASGLPESQYRWAWMTPLLVAETDEQARDLCYEAFEYQVGLFEYEAQRSHEMVDDARKPAIEAGLERFRQMKSNLEESDELLRFMCGSPDTVIEKIQAVRSQLPVNVIMGEFSFGLLDWKYVEQSYRLLAEKVMPAFPRAAPQSASR
ncbi:MAG: LLM class flavin-dependent oxidoreductase [Actinobacteria bacterium]|nr:LLM class flavin-dependent oxidoreductase [Actinomycetota bacterium]